MSNGLTRRRFAQLALGGSLAGLASRGYAARPVELDGLPRSSAARQGVDPDEVLRFLDAVQELELHSFMLARHGRVVAEGWWWPYRADRRHMMHSLTKSVAVCGIGLALEEGRFALDDRVISFFPDELPQQIDDRLAAMTVRDLLTMRTGHASEVSGAVWRRIRGSWIAEFFRIPVVHEPGTKFVYTSAASFMLSAIVTRTTGLTLHEYLRPRLFEPMGMNNLHWDVGPGNINPGGNGLDWTTSDSLKLGLLHARNGRWRGRQLLPESWVRAATSVQVPDFYGYQWWIGPAGAYYALGKFAQVSVVFPQHDAVLAVTAAIGSNSALLSRIWAHFPRAFSGDASSRNAHRLSQRTRSLRLLPEFVAGESARAAALSGRWFEMQQNEDAVRRVCFDFSAQRCTFIQQDERGTHRVESGLRDWFESDTSISGGALHHQYEPSQLRVVAGARWLDENTLELVWQFVETAFRDRLICRFDGEHVAIDRSVNVNSGATFRPTLHGAMCSPAPGDGQTDASRCA